MVRRMGMMVLKAELKSMKSILTEVPGFSRWHSVQRRAEEMAPSVDLFAL